MVTEPHWIYQGRQQHGWFGHGTSSREGSELQADAVQKLDERSAMVSRYAEGHMPYASRFSYARRMGEMGGLTQLKAAMRHWMTAADLHPEAFRRRFLGSDGAARLSRTLQRLARQTRDARYHLDLSEAGGHLAEAAQQVGLDGWPRFLGDLRARAEDHSLIIVSASMSKPLTPLLPRQGAREPSVIPAARTQNPLEPHPDAEGPHTMFRRTPEGHIDNYGAYRFNPYSGKYELVLRFRGSGGPHGQTNPPFVLERKPGEGAGKTPSVARPALPNEIPLRSGGSAGGGARGGGGGGGGMFLKSPFERRRGSNDPLG